MIACREEDGRYTLIAQNWFDVEVLQRVNPSSGGPVAPGPPFAICGVAPELVDQLEVLRIVGVIHESVCCEHEFGRGLQFSLTSEDRARRGRLWFAACPDCGGLVGQSVPIIENLGEVPDCCRLWEEEFAPRVRGEA